MTGSAERLRWLRQLYDAVMDQPPADRETFLDRMTDLDAGMREELDALIAHADDTDVRLESPMMSRARTAADASASLVGQRLGAYDVVRLAGTGGMGAVYEAVRADDQYRKRVAIKIVQRGLDSELSLARFRRERQILATLAHRNIATLLDGGVTPDGRPFLVMEYVEGEPITAWCDARALSLRARVSLFRQVCDAVRHAHANLVVHGDLKPANMLVTGDGTVKLLDFGVAKLLGDTEGDDAMPLTRGGARPFTPEYASPEQIRGDALTTSADVYSLGIVLFELLAGRRPTASVGRSAMEIERAVLTERMPKPSAVATDDSAVRVGERSGNAVRRRLRGDLDQIVLMALRTEPKRRYASVEALDDDLARYLSGRPISAQRDRTGYRIRKFVRRNVAAVGASALVIVALVGGVIATTVQARRARAQQLTAEGVSTFLRDLLSSVKPATGGRDVPVSEVLDAAARRVETELASQPAVRARLEDVIGESYQSLGRYDDAAKHLAAALALHEQLDGPRSTAAIVTLDHMAGLNLTRGELNRADSLAHRALSLRLAVSSAPDTLLATLLDEVGSVAHSRSHDAEAERLHREALAIRRRLFGPRDDKIALSLGNVAVSLGEQNRWAEAEALHRESVAILRANHPSSPDPQLADALNSLATALDLQGKNAAADSAYRETLALRRELFGPDHPDYAFTVMNYSMFVLDQQRYREAMELAKQVLALRGKTIPESHPSIAASLQTLGRCLDMLGDTAGGARALEESLALRRRYLPSDSWLIASSQGVLGEHYVRVREYRKAEQLLAGADSVLTHNLGTDSPRTQANVRRLVALYEAWAQPAKAAAYRSRLTNRTS